MDTNEQSILSFAVCEAQKLEVLRRIHLGDMAFVPVHPQFQLSFQIADAAFQQPFRRSLTFAQQYDVVRIPDHWHTSPFVFPVKFVQVHIRQ